MKKRAFSFFLLAYFAMAFADDQVPLTTQQAEQVSSILGSISAAETPEFKALTQSVSQQSAVASQAAISVPAGNFNDNLLKSGAVEDLSQTLKGRNSQAAASVGPEQIAKTKAELPTFKDLGGNEKKGPYVVVSNRGDEIISMIRALPMRGSAEQQQILKKIQGYGNQGYPEALNFIGLILEYGLFGARVDLDRAQSFYIQAAKSRYQPAIFNLANFAFYGKAGRRDNMQADRLIMQAYGMGNDRSYRVCGLISFLNYRAGHADDALRYSAGCLSPLAKLPNAALSNKSAFPDRIKMLRESIATGVDDGFAELEKVTAKYPEDKTYLYCKYRLVNQIRFTGQVNRLNEDARACYARMPHPGNAAMNKARSEEDIRSIINFVQIEINTLASLRKGNHFHYSWSVPYLPFGQAEVSLFEPIIGKTKK